jgi:1-phosphatidylinositol phosphodiesterase
MKKGSKRFSALNLLWILPLAAVLAFGVFMYLIPALERPDTAPVAGSESWMKALDDSLPISRVVLPGSHDAGTQNVQLAFICKCQTLSVKEQLEAGFRYLDIRIGYGDWGFKLMHGFCECQTGPWPWSQELYLASVIDDCEEFLRDNPTEFIVFAVKYEHVTVPVDEFLESDPMTDYIEDCPEGAWLLTDSIPQVGEARGKIVLLRRYGVPAPEDGIKGLPFIWKDQKAHDDYTLDAADEPNGTYTLHVQDRFAFPVEEKWSAFKTACSEAVCGPQDISLIFLSTKGTAKYGHPYKYAKPLNARLMEADGLTGWIVVDFCTPQLAEKIYSANF